MLWVITETIKVNLLFYGRPISSPKTFRIFDTVEVMKAKLELMRKEAAVQKKCAEEGEDLWSHTPGCGLYRIETRKGFAILLDEEGLQLDLGKRLFENKPFK